MRNGRIKEFVLGGELPTIDEFILPIYEDRNCNVIPVKKISVSRLCDLIIENVESDTIIIEPYKQGLKIYKKSK